MSEPWPTVPLSQVARVERGISWAKSAEVYEGLPGAVPVVRIGNVQVTGLDMTSRLFLAGLNSDAVARKTIDAQTIIMVGSNGNADRIGNVCLATPDVAGHVYASFLIGIRPDEPSTAPYVAYALSSPEVQRAITDATSGSTGLKNIGLTWLRNLEIPWPDAVAQRQIVELLAAADGVVVAADREAKTAAALLTAAREEEIETTAGASIRVAELVASIRVGKSPRCLDRPPNDAEWGVLKLSAVRPAHFEPTEAKALPPSVDPFPEARVKQGDLLVTRSNTIDRVGAACAVDQDVPNLLLSDLIFRIRLHEGIANAEFVAHALSTRAAREQIRRLASGTSGSMKKLNQKTLGALTIPVPSLDRQTEAVALLRSLSRAVVAAQAEREAARTTRSRLLSDLLSGRTAATWNDDRLVEVA